MRVGGSAETQKRERSGITGDSDATPDHFSKIIVS
jgi:hypothetical protein